GPGLCIGGFNRNCFDVFITELTPDGTLAFGTYLGGKFDEYTGSIAVDNSGHIFISGRTDSTDFPTTTGVVQTNKRANVDMFVARINLNGSNGGGGGGNPTGPYSAFLPLVTH
ncbi:MAG TPA: SBBP repeat-containing protein, partial [Roseiflexaceae bacterium]|nr:SBBP repeat-containing protein [Roseiflexaceae bacterium]